MASRLAWWGASCAVLFLTGCTFNYAVLRWPAETTTNSQHVIPGSVEVVAVTAQSVLEQMGLHLAIRDLETSVSITGVTQKGHPFEITLTEHTVNGRTSTSIELDWQTDPEVGFWVAFLKAVTKHHLEQANNPKRGNRGA